jgi:hypothetical protein
MTIHALPPPGGQQRWCGVKTYQGVEKQASGRQPRRAAFWKAQPIQE